MNMKRLLSVAAVAAFAASIVLADVPRPDKPKNPANRTSVDTTLSIQLDREAKDAKLIIPRSQLKQLRAELEQLDGDNNSAVSMASTSIPTIAAGTLLSVAFLFAGLWFAKSGRSSTQAGKAAAAAALLFAGGALTTLIYGNAGPPPEARSITGKMFSQAVHIYGFGSGRIKLEVSDDVTNPKLIVPNPKDTPSNGEE